MSQNPFMEVFEVIEKRKIEMPENSYTTQLFQKGENQIIKKIGEETAELIMAAAKKNRTGLIYETADLFYHIFVLLANEGIHFEEIEKELKRRMGVSGLEEKANRKEK
ncbi:MAG TPA: phosphoribosyl-ATP diphosphatase [Spirochaetia bacterium]|nr:MAG: phosphoribosyl-ATP diphosphatase [Spirochaetes bacterium GWB1_36_13]HCL57149.1 phosphoribosyl-ATP diphosphatase [Spirochaetia bacterium]